MQNEQLRKAEQELLESRRRYTDLFEFAPTGYLTLSAKGLILEANLTLAKMLGVERRHLLKAPFSSFVSPDDQDTYYHHLRHLNDSKEGQKAKLRLRPKVGESFWAALDSVCVSESEQEEEHLRMAVMDITKLKAAEEALQVSEKRFRDLYDNAPYAYFTAGVDDVIRSCNRQAGELLGYVPGELVGVPVLDMYAPGKDGQGQGGENAFPGSHGQILAGSRSTDAESGRFLRVGCSDRERRP